MFFKAETWIYSWSELKWRTLYINVMVFVNVNSLLFTPETKSKLLWILKSESFSWNYHETIFPQQLQKRSLCLACKTHKLPQNSQFCNRKSESDCKRAGAGAEEDSAAVDGVLYNTGMCQCLDLHADVTFRRRARPPFWDLPPTQHITNQRRSGVEDHKTRAPACMTGRVSSSETGD